MTKIRLLNTLRYFFLICVFIIGMLTIISSGEPMFPSFTLIWGIASEDLNSDGVADIVAATSFVHEDLSGEDGYVTALLNDENKPGAKSQSTQYFVGDRPHSVAIGDLNDDGYPDIVSYSERHINILLQDSSSLQPGKFLQPIKIDVGGSIASIAIGDLNEDGLNDIAISGSPPNLSIIFQNSTNPGIFLPPVHLGINSSSIAVADIDGDLKEDLATTGDGVVKLLFQNPSMPGSFQSPLILQTEFWPTSVKIGDLDKDDFPDLIVGNRWSRDDYSAGSVSIFFQDQSNLRDFLPLIDYNVGCAVKEVSIGDLNNDNLLDIAVTKNCRTCKISIMLQDSSTIGFFSPAEDYPCELPYSISIDDMNKDNFNDLIISEDGIVVRFQDSKNPGKFLDRITVYHPN